MRNVLRRVMLQRTLLSGIGLAVGSAGGAAIAAAQESAEPLDPGVCQLTSEQIQGAIAFHGHFCPGLSIGIRAAEWCLREFGSGKDGSVAAVIETDRCGTDAVQFLTGCTFGKGNFVHLNYGKAVYNFYLIAEDRSARLLLNPELTADLAAEEKTLAKEDRDGRNRIRQKMIRRMFDAPLEEMFRISATHRPFVKRVGTKETVRCERCHEPTELTAIQEVQGQKICGECLAAIHR